MQTNNHHDLEQVMKTVRQALLMVIDAIEVYLAMERTADLRKELRRVKEKYGLTK